MPPSGRGHGVGDTLRLDGVDGQLSRPAVAVVTFVPGRGHALSRLGVFGGGLAVAAWRDQRAQLGVSRPRHNLAFEPRRLGCACRVRGAAKSLHSKRERPPQPSPSQEYPRKPEGVWRAATSQAHKAASGRTLLYACCATVELECGHVLVEEEADDGAGEAHEVGPTTLTPRKVLYMPSPMLKPWRGAGGGS